jgi:exonuclease SbcC
MGIYVLKSVTLQDFQSHKYSTFNFDKGLNILTGKSNEGKSSLVRALSLIIYNQWDKSWVRNGANYCIVTLILDNGATIIRQKGEKLNKYVLKIDGKEEEYSNFGLEVPQAIQKALGISKIELDKDDSLNLSIAGQLESLFLFNKSGSGKAKVFGHLSGAHFLDFALRSLATEKKQTNTEKNFKTQELDNLKSQHANLSKIYEFAPTMMGFLAAEGRIEENKERLEGLKDLFKRAVDWKRRYTLETQKESILANAGAVELPSFEASVQRLKSLKQLVTWKADLAAQESTLNAYKTQLDSNLTDRTNEYLKVLGDSGLCPTCFEQLDAQKISKIRENLTGEHKCLV